MDKKRFIIIISFIIFFIVSIITSSIYYKDKCVVIFDTGTEEVILTQYVEKNGRITVPLTPTKEGYVFKEWQFKGKTFDFDTCITQDITLNAKWIKEEYVTINFNTNSDIKIEAKKILKGDTINNLPIAKKEGYEFIGWYLSDNLYDNQEINYDIELVAQYKNNEINTTYKKGDKVKIIGKYSDSAYSYNDYNKIAIGWEREIIDIIYNSEFPYMVGNNSGVTGFFKASSIKRKDD